MPIHMRLPKRGFNKPNRKRLVELNVGRLQAAIDKGLLSDKEPVTEELLVEKGVIRRRRDGVRLLGVGDLKSSLTISVHGASKSALNAVEKAGGKVTLLAPEKDETETKSSKKSKGSDLYCGF